MNKKNFLIMLVLVIIIITLVYFYLKHTAKPENTAESKVNIYQDISLSDEEKINFNTFLNTKPFYISFSMKYVATDNNKNNVPASINFYDDQNCKLDYSIMWADEFDNANYIKNIAVNSSNPMSIKIKKAYIQSISIKCFNSTIKFSQLSYKNEDDYITNYLVPNGLSDYCVLKATKLVFNSDTNTYSLCFDELKNTNTIKDAKDLTYYKDDVLSSYILNFKIKNSSNNLDYNNLNYIVLVSLEQVNSK